MSLYSKIGRKAAVFVVLYSIINPGLAIAATESMTSTPSSNSEWGVDSLRAYASSLYESPVKNLKIPVLMGVEVKNLYDSWGAPRSGGRKHEGIDIMAPRGTPIVSPTRAVVGKVGYGKLGGNYIYTINPGGERFYFAHLDSYAEGMVPGKVLEAGDIIGYVGDTGGAKGTPPHLHFGIYSKGAINPYPRLTEAFTNEERFQSLNKMVSISNNPEKAATSIAQKYKTFLVKWNTATTEVNYQLATAIGITSQPKTMSQLFASGELTRNLKVGSTGADVKALQKFLNTHGVVVALSGIGSPGNESTYFGLATKKALIVYQKSKGINPTTGYFGPLTRASLEKEGVTIVAMNN